MNSVNMLIENVLIRELSVIDMKMGDTDSLYNRYLLNMVKRYLELRIKEVNDANL